MGEDGGAEIATMVIDVSGLSLHDLLSDDTALSRAARRVIEQREQGDDFQICGFSNFI